MPPRLGLVPQEARPRTVSVWISRGWSSGSGGGGSGPAKQVAESSLVGRLLRTATATAGAVSAAVEDGGGGVQQAHAPQHCLQQQPPPGHLERDKTTTSATP